MTTLPSVDSEPQEAPPPLPPPLPSSPTEQIKVIKQQLQVINEHHLENNNNKQQKQRQEEEEEEEEEGSDEEYDVKADIEDQSSGSEFGSDQDDQPKELQEVSFENSQIVFKKRPLDPILDKCDTNPDFAVICSFISKFGEFLDLELNIEHLKSSIENETSLDERLVEIHIKLLKKVHRYFVRDLWEKALVRYIASYSYQDAWEMEELGYLGTRTSIKLQLLVRLLEDQFQVEPRLKAHVSSCDEDKLRLLPMGKDNKGNTYWKSSDKEGNFRIFLEEPLDYKSWKTVCTKPEELNYLIEDLDNNKMTLIKGEPMTEPYNPLPEIFPDFFTKEETNIKEEPSNSNNINNNNYNSNSNQPACQEDEDTIEEPVIEKRTRTARGRSVAVYKEPSPPIEEDDPCSYCDKSNDPELILLCDSCDAGYHISCCLPPLMIIPDGDWYCPTCEHKKLLSKLKYFYSHITKLLQTIEIERARLEKQRLREERKKKLQEQLELQKQQQLEATAKREPKPKPKQKPKQPSQPSQPKKPRQKSSFDNLDEPVGLDELDEILGVETDEEEEQMSSYSNETDGIDDKSIYSSETDELRERGSSYSSETEEDEDQMSLYSGDTEEEEEEEQMSLYSSDGTEADVYSDASDRSSAKERATKKKPKGPSKKRRMSSSDESYQSADEYKPSRNRRRAAAANVCYRASSDEEDEIITYARSKVTATTTTTTMLPEEEGREEQEREVTGMPETNGLSMKQLAMDRVAMSQEVVSNESLSGEVVNHDRAVYQEAKSEAEVGGGGVRTEVVNQEAAMNQEGALSSSSPFHPPFYGPEEF